MKIVLKTAGWLALPARAQLSYYVDGDGEILYTNDKSPQERKGAKRALADKGSVNGSASPDAKQDGPDAHEINPAAPHVRHRPGTETAHQHNIDISTESNWNTAISRNRAWGLMRLVPQTAMHFGVYNPFDRETKRRGGGNVPQHSAGTM